MVKALPSFFFSWWMIGFAGALTMLLSPNVSAAKLAAEPPQKTTAESLEKAFEKMQMLKTSTGCLGCPIYYSYRRTDDDLRLACANTICPNPILPPLPEADIKAAQEFMTKTLEPAAAAMAERSIQAKVRIAKDLEKWMKTEPQLTQGETITVNLFRYLNIIRLAELRAGTKLSKIDLAEVRKHNPDFSESEEKEFNDFFAYFSKIKLPSKTEDWAEFKVKHGEEGAKQTANKMIDAAENVVRLAAAQPNLEVLTKDPSFPTEFTQLERMRLRTETNRFSSADLRQVNSTYSTYKMFLEVASDKKLAEILSRRKFHPKDYLTNETIRKSLDSPNNVAFFRSHYGNGRCTSLRNQLFVATPTEEQVQQLEKEVPNMIQNFLKTVQPHLSKHSLSKVQQAAKAWKIYLPTPREKQIELLKKEIATWERASKKPSTEGLEKTDIGKALLVVVLKDQMTLGLPSDKLCESLLVNQMNDSAKDGRINASIMTVRAQDHKAAIYHELAHLLRDVLKGPGASKETLAWLKKTDQCLKDMHSETTKQNQGQYVEEDWSDLLAFSQTAPANEARNNYACMGLQFAALENGASNAAFTYANTNPNDTHSSPFFRALHAYMIEKKSIPPVCREFVETQNLSIQIRNCLQGVR